MKIVCVSDTHNLHHRISIPEGDMLIHSGDATMRGRVHEVMNFMRWMEGLPHPVKVFVPGNHDFLFDSHRSTEMPGMLNSVLKDFPTITVLRDKLHVLPSGIVIAGTPWVRGLEQWAFGWKSDDGREAEFNAIPPSTDILVTHGPAFGTLDMLYQMPLGDPVLAARIEQLTNLKLHVHGHIHYSYGVHQKEKYTAVNAAICDESYRPINSPIVVEI